MRDPRVSNAPAPDLGLRYRAVDRLGAGSSAEVWRVEECIRGGVYAAKVERPGVGEGARGALGREYARLRWLRHPNVVGVVDVGRTRDGRRYVVSERVQGERADRWRGGSVARLWAVVCQLVEAVDFVHDHGLVHRDVHPGNVLIEESAGRPRVRLMDFGLAAPVGSRGLVGRPGYVAPEIVRGEAVWGREAEWYSVGAVLYEIVVGKRAFAGGSWRAVVDAQDRGVEVNAGLEWAHLAQCIEGLLSPVPSRRGLWWERLREAAWVRGGAGKGWERSWALARLESIGWIGRSEVRDRVGRWLTRLLKGRGVEGTILAVVGEGGTGKSVVLEELMRWVRRQGGEGVRLGQGSEYTGWLRRVACGEAGVDRLELWARVVDELERAGGVVVVDGVGELTAEERGFVEYVHRRAALSQGGRVGLVVGDRDVGAIETLGAQTDLAWGVGETVVLGATGGETVWGELDRRMRWASERDRRELERTVRGWRTGVGEILEGLRRGVLEGALEWSGRGLTLVGTLRAVAWGRGEYAVSVWHRVSESARAVLEVLACGARESEEVKALTGQSDDEVARSVAELEGWAVVEYAGTELAIRGTAAARAVREAMEAGRRDALLEALAKWFQARRVAHDVRAARLEYLEREARVYETLGRWREALRRYVAVVVGWRRMGESARVRAVCAHALDLMRTEARGESTRHRRMAFVRAWVDVASKEGGHRETVRVIEDEYGDDGHGIPPSLLVPYVRAVREAHGHRRARRLARDALGRRDLSAEVRWGVRLEHAGLLGLEGRFDEAFSAFDELERSAGTAEPGMRERLLRHRGAIALAAHRLDLAMEASEQLAKVSRERRSGEGQAFARILDAHTMFQRSRLKEGLRVVARAIREGQRDGTLGRYADELYGLASGFCYEAGRYASALKWIRRARTAATRAGSMRTVNACVGREMLNLLALGDLGGVLTLSRWYWRLPGEKRGVGAYADLEARVVLHDDIQDDEWERRRERIEQMGEPVHHLYFQAVYARWLHANGRRDDAVARVRALMEDAERFCGHDDWLAMALLWLEWTLASAGTTADVEDTYDRIESVVRGVDAPRLLPWWDVLRNLRTPPPPGRGSRWRLPSRSEWEAVGAPHRLRVSKVGFLAAVETGPPRVALELFDVYSGTVRQIAGSVERGIAERFLRGERIDDLIKTRRSIAGEGG